MGWIFGHRNPGESTIAETFAKIFNYNKPEQKQSGKIIACKSSLNVAYMAYEIIDGDRREVIALVCLIKHVKDYYNFGYKDMEENMGPCEHQCPESILDLLTPTTHEYAIEWRKACRDWNEKRKRIHPGVWVRFKEPLRFRNGTRQDIFKYQGKNLFIDQYGSRYRISSWHEYEFTITQENPSRNNQPVLS